MSFEEQDSGFWSGVMRIAFGIVLGVVLLWFIGGLVVGAVMHQTVTELQKDDQAARVTMLEQSRKHDAEQFADRFFAEQRRRDQIAAEAERQHKLRLKDEAWGRFFQRSEQCLRESSVECGNQYIRARREFERRYAAGELQ